MAKTATTEETKLARAARTVLLPSETSFARIAVQSRKSAGTFGDLHDARPVDAGKHIVTTAGL